jgi:hypothetical protein
MSIDQFNILKNAMDSQPDLRNEFELAFASIAAKHHPSDRAERFVFGGTCEWLLAITAWKAGVKALPAGHGQNGFDLMQFKGAVQGLWSLKSSASYTSNSPINLRNNISSSASAASAIYDHPTIFMGPYLPGITYLDFKTNQILAGKIVYDKDAAKIKSKEILDYALTHPEYVIPIKLEAVANGSTIDSNLKLVANVLTSGTYPLLGGTVDILQRYSEKITVLRELHASGSLSDGDFKKSLSEMELK